MAKRMWKLRKGVWAGITPSGRRVVGSKSEVARAVKGSRKTKSKSRSRNKTTKRRRISLPRKRSRRYGFGVRSFFKLVRLGSLFAPAAAVALDSSLDNKGKVNRAIAWYTGYSMTENKFRWEDLKRGWLPFVVVSLFTTLIQKINGIIRRL